MKKLPELLVILIGVLWPLVGIVWLDWDITEVIFLYGLEAGWLAFEHAFIYWKTARRLSPHLKQGYVGTALLRVVFEIVITLCAFTILLRASTDTHATIFSEPGFLLQYAWVTLIPTVSICIHGAQTLMRRWQQPAADMRQVSSIWFWLFTLPLPAFIYSYLFISWNEAMFIVLVILLSGVKLIVDIVCWLERDAQPFPKPSDAGTLQPWPYSANQLIALLWGYVVIGVGFLSVNPFTQDPKYTLSQNLIIYLVLLAATSPLLISREITIQLDKVKRQIIVTTRWLGTRQRVIALADITGIEVKQNQQHITYAYVFTLRDGKTWKCSNGSYYLPDWAAWMGALRRELKV